MYLCRVDLNNNSYKNVTKLNLQFIYLAFFHVFFVVLLIWN